MKHYIYYDSYEDVRRTKHTDRVEYHYPEVGALFSIFNSLEQDVKDLKTLLVYIRRCPFSDHTIGIKAAGAVSTILKQWYVEETEFLICTARGFHIKRNKFDELETMVDAYLM